jgi:hypothetical protein
LINRVGFDPSGHMKQTPFFRLIAIGITIWLLGSYKSGLSGNI